MSRKTIVTLVALVIVVDAVFFGAFMYWQHMKDAQAVTESPSLPVLYPAPAFELTSATGKPFDSASLAGKVWVVDFFFTSCAGVCPQMQTSMMEIAAEFADDPRVEFVSITVDPDTDTPERMAEYSKRYNADLERWHYLTGPMETIEQAAYAGFKLGSVDEPIFHSDRFVLVDPDGQIRGYYKGTEAEPVVNLKANIATLLEELPA